MLALSTNPSQTRRRQGGGRAFILHVPVWACAGIGIITPLITLFGNGPCWLLERSSILSHKGTQPAKLLITQTPDSSLENALARSCARRLPGACPPFVTLS